MRFRASPPHDGREARSYPPTDAVSIFAGRLPNQPPNRIRWLRDPPSINPHPAMPILRLSHQDALGIAAYLYSLSR